MTPRTQEAANMTPDISHADDLRSDYRFLMRKAARETFDRNDAMELIHVCLQLGKLGYTLTADESDWQPGSLSN